MEEEVKKPGKKRTPEQAERCRENGKLGGRPRRYKTPEDLEAKIDQYFTEYNCKEKAPKWQSMLLYLNLSDEALRLYRTDERYIKEGYLGVIKRAEQRHSEFWQQLALDYPNLQSYCIFQLKQAHNGGFTDKQVSESNNKSVIELKISGID